MGSRLYSGGEITPRVSEEEIRELFAQGFGYLTKDGKKRVLDADGLLVLAGKHGLKGIKTELLDYRVEEKSRRCIVKATVEFDGGESYQGICEIVDRDLQHPKYFVRACETRAVARALRFAFAIPLSFRVEESKVKPEPKPREEDIKKAEEEEERAIAEAEEIVEEELEW